MGKPPVYAGGSPVVIAGVVPGYGPTFSDVIFWKKDNTLFCHFRPTKSSSSVSSDENVFSNLYIRNGYLVWKSGSKESVYATTWAANDLVKAKIQISGNLCRVGRDS